MRLGFCDDHLSLDFGHVSIVEVGSKVPGGEEIPPDYEGSYEITPSAGEQVIKTKGVKMKDDIVIKPIPVYEVSNSHGMTFIIVND